MQRRMCALNHEGLGAPVRWIMGAVIALILSNVSAYAAFQEALWGARPAALAGAFTALADDANAPAYNPAGISLLDRNEITFMYAQLYSGLNLYAGEDTSRLGLNYFSFAPSIKDKEYGSFAFSWSNFTATNLYREDSFTLTWADARQFEAMNAHPIFAYGANLKLLRRAFSTDSRTDNDPVFRSNRDSNALSADVGAIYRPDMKILPGLKVGANIQNINEPDMGLQTTDRVPARYTVGVAYQDLKYRWFNPALDISRRRGRTLVAGAWEGWFVKNTLAFRFGGDKTQLTGGMGYQFMILDSTVIRLDYAILWPLEIEDTNGSHRISLTTSF
jgi:hypothetical protein